MTDDMKRMVDTMRKQAAAMINWHQALMKGDDTYIALALNDITSGKLPIGEGMEELVRVRERHVRTLADALAQAHCLINEFVRAAVACRAALIDKGAVPTTCKECGKPAAVDDAGVSYHMLIDNDGLVYNLDHDTDRDHTAILDKE